MVNCDDNIDTKIDAFYQATGDLDYNADNLVFYYQMLIRVLNTQEAGPEAYELIDYYLKCAGQYSKRYLETKRALKEMLADNPMWLAAAEATKSVLVNL